MALCSHSSERARPSGSSFRQAQNRDIVSRECQACHDLGLVVAATGLTREGWTNILAEMTTYGMSVTPDDQGKIIDYLSTYLGPR